jgi:hypothetical protein
MPHRVDQARDRPCQLPRHGVLQIAGRVYHVHHRQACFRTGELPRLIPVPLQGIRHLRRPQMFFHSGPFCLLHWCRIIFLDALSRLRSAGGRLGPLRDLEPRDAARLYHK